MRGYATTALTTPPFPSRLHPDASEVAAHTVRWAERVGLAATAEEVERLRGCQTGEFAARVCPDAPAAAADLFADLASWFFTLDDQWDEGDRGRDPGLLAPVIAELMEVLDRLGEGEALGPPAARALHDLCRRVRAAGSAGHLHWFTARVRDYLFALGWESSNRAQQRVPTVAEYAHLRRHTSGVAASLVVADLAHGVAVVEGRLTDPNLGGLDRLVTDWVAWCNDVFSYAKERDRGAAAHNLVTVLMRETGCTEPEGLAEAAARCNGRLAEYLAAEQVALAGGDAEVARMIGARRCFLRGAYDWSVGTYRYA